MSERATRIAASLALALLCAAPAFAEEVRGQAIVVDGDTLKIGETTVRLFGIDAPEHAQTCTTAGGSSYRCGDAATDRARALTSGHPTTCRGTEHDAYGRLLATCEAGGVEINATLVREGLAWAFLRYSIVYAPQEKEARDRKLGVFATTNEPPWEFRAKRWSSAAPPTPAPGRDCPIKGNISRKGERIYHMPWQLDYARTRIDEGQGERWFCDESEAVAAGWRKAAR